MHLLFPDGRPFSLDAPRIMGVLNVTPDSFSDGGRFTSVDAAVRHGQAMIQEGADLIDIGGQSTRPGAQAVPALEQIHRLVPVIAALARPTAAIPRPVPISVDADDPVVAAAALDAGATIINDIYAGQRPGMLELAAARKAPIILMHMQGTPATMQQNPQYTDVVAQVRDFLLERAAAARAAGVAAQRIVLDPGLGFGKTLEHNLKLLQNLDVLRKTGYPVLLGASRKSSLAQLGRGPQGEVPRPDETVGATCATTTWGVWHGVHLFRVHDVRANRQAAQVAWALRQVS